MAVLVRLVSLLAGAYCFALLGCVSTSDPNAPLSTVRAYDLGAGQHMITCVDSPRYCAEQVRRTCPAGSEVVSNTTNPADHGRMTMIIRCA